MRKVSLFIVLAAASLPVAAQQQQKQQSQPPTANAPDKELVDRTRVDGSAGGTAPVPPEKRKAVGAGAGPHRKDNLPSPQKLPKDEPVEPPR
jgi:hypothetical protein